MGRRGGASAFFFGARIGDGFVGFDKSRSEQGHHDFVMAGERVAGGFFRVAKIGGGRIGRGALDDVLQRTVMLQEIEIRGGDGAKRRAEIARDGDSLQKDFGQNDGGAPVQINAAGMHSADESAEQFEIVVRGSAEVFAGSGAMNVRNIRADGDVDSHRNFFAIGGGENAFREILRARALANEEFPRRFTEADAGAARERGHFVDVAASFFGHAEFAFAENGVNIFRSAAGHGDFEIVNQRRAVHGDAADEAAAHEVDQERAEADLDDVAAHAPENRGAASARFDDGSREGAQIFRGENVRKRIEKFGEGSALTVRLRELADADFARTRSERVGVQAVKIQRLDIVDARRFARQA